MMIPKVTLNNGVAMPMFIVGTNMQSKEQLRAIVNESLRLGCRAFDTAPNYNSGKWLGELINEEIAELGIKREDLFIQSKLDWNAMLAGKEDEYLDNAMKVMKLDYLDSWVMHWPQPDTFTRSYKKMEKALKSGRVKAIGTCNFHIRHWCKLLNSGIEIVPQINQIELHPLRTCIEEVDFCNKHGIATQSYSPVCKMLPPVSENKELRDMAVRYGCSVAQLVLAWHISRGLCPISKTTKPHRIADNLRCLEIRFSREDITAINTLNRDYKLIVESIACPGF